MSEVSLWIDWDRPSSAPVDLISSIRWDLIFFRFKVDGFAPRLQNINLIII